MNPGGSRAPGGLARGAAVTLCVLFVLILPPAMAVRNLGTVLFSPESVVAALEGSFVEGGGLKLAVIEALARDEGPADGTPFSIPKALAHLSPEQKLSLGELLFPDDWVRAQIRANVEVVYLWLDDGGAPPTLAVDLGARKAEWISGDINTIVTLVMDSWPACSAELVGQILGATLSGNLENLPLCRPGDPIDELVGSIAATGVKAALMQAPDRLVILDSGERIGPERMEVVRLRWVLGRRLAMWAWLVPAALLVMVGLLVGRDRATLAAWLGWPLLLSGVAGWLLLAAAFLVAPSIWASAFPSAGLARLLGGTISALARQAGVMQAWQAAGLMLVGGGGLAIARLRRRTKRQIPDSPRGPSTGRSAGMFG